ncbi:MAG: transporter substrate-binding domain-containing protein, partial [Rhodospirillales bacterium]
MPGVAKKPLKVWRALPKRVLAWCAMLCFLVPVCSAHAQPSNSRQDVTAVVLRDFPPLYKLNEAGQPEGFAIDLLVQVAGKAGLRVNYLVVENWQEAMEAVRSRRGDFVPAYGILPQHETEFVFSRAVETIPVSVFVRGETYSISGPE